MTQEEFDTSYAEALDAVLSAMAESEGVGPQKFFAMACVLENLRFFSPVLYAAIVNREPLA